MLRCNPPPHSSPSSHLLLAHTRCLRNHLWYEGSVIERVEGGSGAVIATMAAAPEVGGAPGAGADAEQQQQHQQPAMHMDVDQQQPAEHGDDDAVPARVHIKFDAFSSKFNECAFVPLGGGCRAGSVARYRLVVPLSRTFTYSPPPPSSSSSTHTHTHHRIARTPQRDPRWITSLDASPYTHLAWTSSALSPGGEWITQGTQLSNTTLFI